MPINNKPLVQQSKIIRQSIPTAVEYEIKKNNSWYLNKV